MDNAETATVDTVVTDPAWLARRDQTTAALDYLPLASLDIPPREPDQQDQFS